MRTRTTMSRDRVRTGKPPTDVRVARRVTSTRKRERRAVCISVLERDGSGQADHEPPRTARTKRYHLVTTYAALQQTIATSRPRTTCERSSYPTAGPDIYRRRRRGRCSSRAPLACKNHQGGYR